MVELMVVVAILGILVAVALPVFNHSAENSRMVACQTNERTISGAATQFWHQHGRFPNNIDELVDTSYLQSYPTCPEGGTYDYDKATGTVDCSLPTH